MILICMTFGFNVLSAQIKDEVKVAVRPAGDQLIIRWAPTTEKAWLRMKSGHALVAWQSWEPKQGFRSRSKMQWSDTLKVWPKERVEGLVGTSLENEKSMLAGYLLYAPYETSISHKVSATA